MKSKIILSIFGLLLFLFAVLYNTNYNQSEKEQVLSRSSEIIKESKKSEVIIDYGNGKIASYSAVLGNTVYDVLTNAKEDISIKEYDFGIIIKSIDGYGNDKNRAWMYYVNGKMGDRAADKYELNMGDMVEWRYIKINN